MKRIIFFICCFFLFIVCHSQEVNISQLVLKDGIYYTNSTKKYTGKILYYYDNGNLLQESLCYDGKLNGKSTKFYKGGQVKETCNYEDGIMVDEFVTYYKNGQMKSIEKYGYFATFYENGQTEGSGVIGNNGYLYLKKYKPNGERIPLPGVSVPN